MVWLGALEQMIQIRRSEGAVVNVKEFTLHSFISHSASQLWGDTLNSLTSSQKSLIVISVFLEPQDTNISKDFHKIITKEHFYSNSKSQLIIVGWKVIRSSSQRRAHQTRSLQASSGFISVSFALSRPVMTSSRLDCSPLRGGDRGLWNIEPRNIIWSTISWPPAELLRLTVMTVAKLSKWQSLW